MLIKELTLSFVAQARALLVKGNRGAQGNKSLDHLQCLVPKRHPP